MRSNAEALKQKFEKFLGRAITKLEKMQDDLPSTMVAERNALLDVSRLFRATLYSSRRKPGTAHSPGHWSLLIRSYGYTYQMAKGLAARAVKRARMD